MSVGSDRIFGDVPDDSESTARFSILIGGMATASSDIDIARSYIQAAEVLISDALKNGDGWRVQYPLLLLYRHALELYLKAIVKPPKLNHRLEPLVLELDQLLHRTLQTSLPVTIKQELLTLARLDPVGESFRYTESRNETPWLRSEGEHWVQLDRLQEFMNRVFRGLEDINKILERQA